MALGMSSLPCRGGWIKDLEDELVSGPMLRMACTGPVSELLM